MLENELFHYYSLEFLRLIPTISILKGFLAHLIHILKIFLLIFLNIFKAEIYMQCLPQSDCLISLITV